MIQLLDRFKGCLLGLAVGDAIGTTLEFKPPGSFKPISDMVGGGPFYLQPGQWTDDTSMAICLAESLLECQGFDAADQMRRYCQWWQEGHNSSTGRCFDIGATVANALHAFQTSGDPFSGDSNPMSAGNGSLMRLAPVVLNYYSATDLYHYVAESSRTTHAAKECLDACCFFAALIRATFNGEAKADLLNNLDYQPLTRNVRGIASFEFIKKSPQQIRGSGYVIDCLESALWCFYKTESFDDAVLMAANLGDDADTTAAVCGQLAGAYYGVGGIRSSWLEKLFQRDELSRIAERLYNQAVAGKNDK